MWSHLRSRFSLRQSGNYHSFVIDFSPARRKIDNRKTENTMLPQAIRHVEVAIA
jgi:hypothetical protein